MSQSYYYSQSQPIPYYPPPNNQQYYQSRQQTYSTSPQSPYSPTYSSPGYPSPQSPYQSTYQQPPPIRSSSSSGNYYCLFANCTHASARKADLERHVDAIHNRSAVPLVNCSWPGCTRTGAYGFTRKDKMVDHLREVHKADIPKRVSGGGSGSGGGRRERR